MDWILIGAIGILVLFIYVVGYLMGKATAKDRFIKLLLKHKVRLIKTEKPKDLEYGKNN